MSEAEARKHKWYLISLVYFLRDVYLTVPCLCLLGSECIIFYDRHLFLYHISFFSQSKSFILSKVVRFSQRSFGFLFVYSESLIISKLNLCKTLFDFVLPFSETSEQYNKNTWLHASIGSTLHVFMCTR